MVFIMKSLDSSTATYQIYYPQDTANGGYYSAFLAVLGTKAHKTVMNAIIETRLLCHKRSVYQAQS
jgi:hypothetical protein